MNHLVQIARRTGKAATGFKVQLVVHRLTASLPSLNGAELVAVVTGHKKRMATKSAAYSAAQKEVVWGDILPFSSTLYMAKTGLFQAKLFQINVFDAKTEAQVAAFEFNLAELVSAVKESGKESLTVSASRCHDPRAAISLTVISTRVILNRAPGSHAEADQLETSFDDSRSDFSVCTIESHTSTASSTVRNGRPLPGPHDMPTSPPGKSDGLRGPMSPGSASDSSEVESLRSKNHQLLTTLQDLESQLRQSEAANVQLEAANEMKDREIQELRDTANDLEQQLNERPAAVSKPRVGSVDDEDGVMQVDFIQYMTLKEELEAIKIEREDLREQLEASASRKESDSDDKAASEDQEERGERTSSGNEYVDAQEPQLLAEISELKHSVTLLRGEGEEQKATIRSLMAANELLTTQVTTLQVQSTELEAELNRKDVMVSQLIASAAARSNEVCDDDEEENARARKETDIKVQNERLMDQLHQLDSVVTKLKDDKVTLLGKLQEAETENEKALSDVKAANAVVDELEGEKSVMVGKLLSSEQANEETKQELSTAEATIDELREQVKQIAEELQATQQQLDTLRNEELAVSVAATAAAVAKNQELQDRWTELRDQNEQLQQRVDEVEAILASEQSEGRARERELQDQVAALRQETESLREELEQLGVSKQAAEDELHARTLELQEALEGQRRLTVDRDERVGSLEMSNEDLRARADEKEAEWVAKVRQLELENDYFQRELIDSKMRLAELTQQNDELTQSNKKAEKTLIELQIAAAEKNLKANKKK